MKIIPVLDIQHGRAVRGIAGRREEYRPLAQFGEGDPLTTANAYRTGWQITTLYLADLDAILRDRPNWDIYQQLLAAGFDLWIDAGSRDARRVQALLGAGVTRAIVPLECWTDLETLPDLCRQSDPARLIFSLDLHGGRIRGAGGTELRASPEAVASQVVAAGFRALLVLDLVGVGSLAGVPTLPLCRQIRQQFPDIELLTGGGVRDIADLQALAAEGIDAALVGSAFYDGRLTREEVARISARVEI